MINMIVALSANNKIGCKGKLPWNIPEDMRFFKRMTTGKVVVMGRKTFESIGKPLPNRVNIVLTRDKNYKQEGVVTCNSVDEVLSFVNSTDTFIIGGGQIYELFMPHTDRIYITFVDLTVDGDTEFPYFRDRFTLSDVTAKDEQDTSGIRYCFSTWDRV